VLPEVFLHGDVRADNLLYSPDRSEVVLVDWQGACLGARTWDLSYFLIQCLTVEDREKWQSDLLMLYCDEVARVTPGISHQNLFVEVESH
jgi:thiamine kinase-like enzyme